MKSIIFLLPYNNRAKKPQTSQLIKITGHDKNDNRYQRSTLPPFYP
jgi:hypothetical protein